MLPALDSVTAVLRHHEGAGVLQQVGPLVSSFMGPSPHLSLSEACALQSLALLDRLWGSSCVSAEDRSPHWSLCNFLRSDKFYSRWQFAQAVQVAVEKQDVAMLKWLLEHFQGCVVTSDIVGVAAERGDISVLQVLLAHTGNTVQWGGSSIQQALMKGQLEAAHWLYKNVPLEEMSDNQRTWTVKAAMDAGDLAFCKVLMPKGRCILDYAQCCSTPDLVEWKLACGYLKRDAFDAVVSIRELAATDRVDLMQKISDERSNSSDELLEDSMWLGEWENALHDACEAGNLTVVKWLVEHSLGRQTLTVMKSAMQLGQLLLWSAGKGHVEVMQYLSEQGAVEKFANALVRAVGADQMESVKWLVEHFPATETIPDYCVLDEATRHGRIKFLELFQSLGTSSVPGFFPAFADEEGEQSERVRVMVAKADRHRKVYNKQTWPRTKWKSTDSMDDAAANGELETVKWLHENRTEGCTTDAMNEAAANGYLEVVKWLNAHRSEGCTDQAMDFAAANGHLEIVQWLHENTTTGCTSAAMNLAAGGGHLNMLKWIKLHSSEGCAVEAIQYALTSSHLSVACWLLDQFPENIRLKIITLLSSNKKFDVLLFLHTRFPELITLDFVRKVRSPLIERGAKRYDMEVVDWLAAHYPLPEGEGEQFEGLAGQILGNIAQQIAGQLGGGVPGHPVIGPQRVEPQNNALAMVMNNIMVVVDGEFDEGEDLDDNA